MDTNGTCEGIHRLAKTSIQIGALSFQVSAFSTTADFGAASEELFSLTALSIQYILASA